MRTINAVVTGLAFTACAPGEKGPEWQQWYPQNEVQDPNKIAESVGDLHEKFVLACAFQSGENQNVFHDCQSGRTFDRDCRLQGLVGASSKEALIKEILVDLARDPNLPDEIGRGIVGILESQGAQSTTDLECRRSVGEDSYLGITVPDLSFTLPGGVHCSTHQLSPDGKLKSDRPYLACWTKTE